VRPTTVLSLVAAVLIGAAGVALSIYLIVDHHSQQAKWHYWLAPLLMIGAAVTLWQLTAMYMQKVGRAELRSRPPTRD
jgi:fucose permease